MGTQLGNASLTIFQFGGDEAFFVGQGLASDLVVRHRSCLGFAHRENVAEGQAVLQVQGAGTAHLLIMLLILSEPGDLIIELVAEAIDFGLNTIVKQTPFAEGQQRRLYRGLIHCACRLVCVLHIDFSGQFGNPFQPLCDGDLISGTLWS